MTTRMITGVHTSGVVRIGAGVSILSVRELFVPAERTLKRKRVPG